MKPTLIFAALILMLAGCGGASVPPTVDPVSVTETAATTAISAPTQTAIAAMSVSHNADWTPVERDFDGVTMMLVPAGCFNMGSDTGYDDEKPIHQICFEMPYWIDKFEVTQAQFREHGGSKTNANGFTGDERPVERITWLEADAYCNQRGARLPTEAEWEYAARGPDSLIYPWGDTFVSDNVVNGSNSGSQTASVGSRPGGASWVGAQDLSGNVWEWTSSLYQPYPYDAQDGREADTGDRTDVLRVMRGAAWNDPDTILLPFRLNNTPVNPFTIVGLRCARSS